MDWMLMPLRRYADFQGRSQRKEFWMFQLGVFVAAFVIAFLYGVTGGNRGGMSTFVMVIGVLALLAILVPAIAVQVRRFHDQDKSGWFVLLNFVPYVGGIIVLVMMCLDGTLGPNRFGPDPKGGAQSFAEVFS